MPTVGFAVNERIEAEAVTSALSNLLTVPDAEVPPLAAVLRLMNATLILPDTVDERSMAIFLMRMTLPVAPEMLNSSVGVAAGVMEAVAYEYVAFWPSVSTA